MDLSSRSTIEAYDKEANNRNAMGSSRSSRIVFNSNLNMNNQDIDSVSVTSTAKSHHSSHSLGNIEKKATHSEIEKRRRQKMNKYLNELVFNLPMSSAKNKRPDKISILKMAVQHMKNLKASTSILSDSFLCQNYISPIELQSMVLKETNEFLIVIKCDSSKILYASETSFLSIGFLPSELIDKVFFEIVHPSDTKQVKDQLTYNDFNSASNGSSNFMINKAKSYTTGERRSFLCRIRSLISNRPDPYNNNSNDQEDAAGLNNSTSTVYKVVHFVGYLRSDTIANMKFSDSNVFGNNQNTNSNNTSSNYSNNNNNSSISNDTSLLAASSSSQSADSAFNSSPSLSNSQQKSNSFYNYHSITLLGNNENSANASFVKTKSGKHQSSGSNAYAMDQQANLQNLNGTNSSSQNNTLSTSGNTNNSYIHYLIAYGQVKQPRPMQDDQDDPVAQKFMSRHDIDGKFVYVDPSVHSIIGYMPHQLISESIFSHVHPDDVNLLKKAFQEAVSTLKNQKIRTYTYRLKIDDNASTAYSSSNNPTYVSIESILYALHNPFSNQLEYIVAQNRLCSNATIVSSSAVSNQQTSKTNSNTNCVANTTNITKIPFHQQQQHQHQTNTLNGITLPMTPSPEEYIYNTGTTTSNNNELINQNIQNRLQNVTSSKSSLAVESSLNPASIESKQSSLSSNKSDLTSSGSLINQQSHIYFQNKSATNASSYQPSASQHFYMTNNNVMLNQNACNMDNSSFQNSNSTLKMSTSNHINNNSPYTTNSNPLISNFYDNNNNSINNSSSNSNFYHPYHHHHHDHAQQKYSHVHRQQESNSSNGTASSYFKIPPNSYINDYLTRSQPQSVAASMDFGIKSNMNMSKKDIEFDPIISSGGLNVSMNQNHQQQQHQQQQQQQQHSSQHQQNSTFLSNVFTDEF